MASTIAWSEAVSQTSAPLAWPPTFRWLCWWPASRIRRLPELPFPRPTADSCERHQISAWITSEASLRVPQTEHWFSRPKSGHFIHVTEPELAVWAIRRVIVSATHGR